MREAEIPYEGVRDVPAAVLAIEGINFTASVITLATLRAYAPKLVAAIRRWRLRRPANPADGPIRLTVKGTGVDLRLELPPNVSTKDLLRQLAPLLEDDEE